MRHNMWKGVVVGASEGILTAELRLKGFDLQEDDHCLFLLYGGEMVAAFAASGARVAAVREAADKMDAHKSRGNGPKPRCQLAGAEGSVFILAGRVWRALNDAGMAERAAEFVQKLSECQSYDETLNLVKQYVEIY